MKRHSKTSGEKTKLISSVCISKRFMVWVQTSYDNEKMTEKELKDIVKLQMLYMLIMFIKLKEKKFISKIEGDEDTIMAYL